MISLIFTLGLLHTQLLELQAEIPHIEVQTPKIVHVDKALFERIALCESGNDPKAKNPHSSASGRFQFLKGSWNYYGKQLWGDKLAEKDVLDYEDNTELAWYVFQKNGTSDWLESKHCWDSPKKE